MFILDLFQFCCIHYFESKEERTVVFSDASSLDIKLVYSKLFPELHLDKNKGEKNGTSTILEL